MSKRSRERDKYNRVKEVIDDLISWSIRLYQEDWTEEQVTEERIFWFNKLREAGLEDILFKQFQKPPPLPEELKEAIRQRYPPKELAKKLAMMRARKEISQPKQRAARLKARVRLRT